MKLYLTLCLAVLILLGFTLTNCQKEQEEKQLPSELGEYIVSQNQPTCDFTVDITSIVDGVAISFTSQSTNGPNSYLWDFGDDSTSRAWSPTHIYNIEGVYTVTLTVSNSYGIDTETKTNLITVYPSEGTVTDIEGNIYKTKVIGTQTWMVENLKTIHYNDGTDIPNVTDDVIWYDLITPAYSWYDNDDSNKNIHGALYNWYVIETGKLCPSGWHVPTAAEWETLIDFLGGGGGYELRDIISIPMSGYRDNNGVGITTSFIFLGYRNYWWSSSESYNQSVWSLRWGLPSITHKSHGKNHGHSVWCIKD